MKLNFFYILFLFISFINKPINGQTVEKPQNIILLIGDGMGFNHVYLAYTANHGNLAMMTMPVTGMIMTHSANRYVTDSGAGGTALSTGKKTYNGAIGVGEDSTSLRSILEIADSIGLSTGLISTSAVTHATPASFIAHVNNRKEYEEIALDFLDTDVDIVIGGGLSHFSKRSDGMNLLDSLRKKGYAVTNNLQSISAFDSKYYALIDSVHCPSISKGRENMLPFSTKTALRQLSKNPKGFFIMIEGSQIDWDAHEGNTEGVIKETLDFDMAVAEAIAFAKEDKNTLVIVTADHETGGLTLLKGNMEKGTVNANFSTHEHTGVFVPVFAYGQGAEMFTGVYQNTSIFDKMLYLLTK